MSETQAGHRICINTARANQLAVEGIEQGVITELANYQQLRTEVKYGSENSRIDVLLSDPERAECYIEVKSVTLLDDNQSGQGYFPDAVTTRGQKHLRELTEMVKNGNRSVLLFIVLHSGIEKVSPAHHIDADYSQLLKKAIEQGVEILCYKADISQGEIKLAKAVDFRYLG
ncbi:sugar/maltose fermentation stimulation protein homolog [Vibrio ponticus]|nr:sugar/maltose fermentation stimulation protein homolog [Vibrio ponticus]